MIQLPIEPKVLSKVDNKTIFEIGPLYPGYGTTIGNTLRRVLISSISGAAITSVKIKGVDHEFSTIQGVMEDVLEIIMNLKRVRFKVFRDEPITLALSAKGTGEVTAKDIAEHADVEVVNPNQKISVITDKKTELEMEIKVEKGVGYIPVEQRHKEKLTVGEIAIDGIFTPIKNVHYTVENLRVGQRTDYNKIIMEIETDGSISPEETLKTASQILLDHFQIIHAIQVPEPVEKKPSKKVKRKK